MKRPALFAAGLMFLAGCGVKTTVTVTPAAPTVPQPAPASASPAPTPASPPPLAEARRGHQPRPKANRESGEAIPEPPAGVFRLVKYRAPVGDLAALVTPDPGDGERHPAIVWITGGDCNSIGDLWSDAPRSNDQHATAYRKAGIVLMFPSLRGGNTNPGRREGFFGEVDDILAAADELARQPYVDPNRIYLGGHSTGGTLAMLVAESTDRFRASFAFGPVGDIRGYPDDFRPFDDQDDQSIILRSPGYWLNSVRRPLYVIEGDRDGNVEALEAMRKLSTNPQIHFNVVAGTDHFGILAPTNEAIARQILRDTGPEPRFEIPAR